VTVSATATAQRIPTPPDFPVPFAPGEERLLWDRDRTHFPQQMTPLEADVVGALLVRGMEHAFERYAVPVAGARARTFHGWHYSAIVPLDADADELAARADASEAAMRDAIARLDTAWDDDWLPEIRAHLEAMEAVDPRAVPSTVGLVDVLESHWERMQRLWELHFEIVFPAYVAVSEFEDLHRELLGGEGLDAYRLLGGFATKTFEVGCDLWRISRIALRSAAVTEVLAQEAAADVPAALQAIPEGRALLAELDAHLAAYGHRTATWGLATRSFVEDPTPVLKVLKDYATRPDADSPARELERQGRERDAAVAEVRERLRGYPAPIVAEFHASLACAQVGLLLTEDHGFYIDAYAVSLVRDLLSEMGRRLVAEEILDDPDDVLMLTYDELRVAALDLAATEPRTIVARRRAELAAYAHVAAPKLLGTLPAGPRPDSPLMRMVAKFATPPSPPSEPDTVSGFAGSAGTVTGVARVVRSLADAERLVPGEVLVAETTAPPWTPLFAVVAAVVTDTGGVLSHSAVVAREYGIPAVVGAGDATAVIQDGDLVEVDGAAGVVRIVR